MQAQLQPPDNPAIIMCQESPSTGSIYDRLQRLERRIKHVHSKRKHSVELYKHVHAKRKHSVELGDRDVPLDYHPVLWTRSQLLVVLIECEGNLKVAASKFLRHDSVNYRADMAFVAEATSIERVVRKKMKVLESGSTSLIALDSRVIDVVNVDLSISSTMESEQGQWVCACGFKAECGSRHRHLSTCSLFIESWKSSALVLVESICAKITVRIKCQNSLVLLYS
jgi:hypothetical protein